MQTKDRDHIRVLVADDNPENRKVILAYLESLKFKAEAVANGEEAVTAFTTGSFDLILMDCQMPEMDGYEATRRIREIEQSPLPRSRTPVVALTAHAVAGDRTKCHEAGMDDFLSKPLRVRDLERTLIHWLSQGAQSTPTQQSELGGARAPVVDAAFLASLEALQSTGQPDLIVELIEYFQSAGPNKVKGIKDAISDGNLKKAQSEAHSFKSTCHNVGARKLAEVCQLIESSASEELIRTLEVEFSTASAELRQFITRRGQAAPRD